jgi:putative nucleotidyltransferase with HDIG domain
MVLREEAWQHSLSTGFAANRLAKELALPYPEEAFIYGLLHDLGKLALIYVLPEQYVKAYAARTWHRSLGEAEAEEFGVSHPLVGAVVAHKWRFPVDICETIRLHHEALTLPPGHAFADKAALVHLADLIAHYLGHGHRHGEDWLLTKILSAALHFARGREEVDLLISFIDREFSTWSAPE